MLIQRFFILATLSLAIMGCGEDAVVCERDYGGGYRR